MKKKIFLGLLVLILCFTGGGIYITLSMDGVIARLEKVILLHQVEFMRESLLNQIKIVQTDLLLKGSPHSRNIDTFVRHGEKIGSFVKACHDCHHEEKVRDDLTKLRDKIALYQKKLSRVYTIRANAARLDREKKSAYDFGEEILEEVSALVITSAEKINYRIIDIRNNVAISRAIVLLVLIIGPIIIIGTTFYFTRRFTGSVTTLIKATRKIKEGDLTYRITGNLKDEFHELAVAFNDMATSLKKQCEIVESAQKRYRLLFENAGDAIFILEAEGKNAGRIVSANQEAADMHGYTLDEILSLRIQDLDAPETAAQAGGRIQRILGGEKIHEAIEHMRKDGTVFPVEITASLLEVDNHNYVLAIDRDITERVLTEKTLQRSKQMIMVGEMAAGLAHEIKNPLAGIKVSMEVLANELAIKQEDREVFLQIVGEINRIEKLLKNLLNYARPPKPNFDAINLNTVLENALKNVQFTLKNPSYAVHKQKKIDFIKELGDDLPSVMADSSQLQQVFLNLLLNAVESISEAGTITVKTAFENSGNIKITFADTGKGLDEPTMKKIFHPFFTTKPKGSGLGLAISKRLVEQHNGTITVANNPEIGLTFTITLPIKQHVEDDTE